MKKIIIIFCAILLFAGCSCSLNDNTPEEAIETLFEKYRNKDDNIITQLKETIENEKLGDQLSEDYEALMEKQYDQFAYVIKDVSKNDDTATATVELTVLDYKSAMKEAENELKEHPEKFNNDEGSFSEDKYKSYKIDLMKDVTETTTYTIELNLTKENGMWKVEQLSDDDISKLHGIY